MKTTLLLVIILLAGCSSQEYRYSLVYQPRVEWPLDEYKKIEQHQGSNIVTGQCFLKTRGGDVKTCAGNKVYLNPVTSYSKQFVDVVIHQYTGRGVVLEPTIPDYRINDFLEETVADADGRFKFYNVPDGEYYLYSSVLWEAGTGYQGKLEQQGGWVLKKVSIVTNNRNEYIVTGI